MDNIGPFSYLTRLSSIAICLIISLVYVFGLYLFSPSTKRYDRNDSHVIRRRFLAVFIVCSLIYFFLKVNSDSTFNINSWLGFRIDIFSIWTLFFYPLVLTLTLYFGPLVQWFCFADWFYYRYHWRHFSFIHWTTHEKLVFLRNYIIAPFTEEFVFRSSTLCLLYSHVSVKSAIFASPLFFGLAHFHHMLEHFKQNQKEQNYRLSAMSIILAHLFQFSYTYIFGIYSSFLFIRTGHFLPSFLVHTLCNGLGIPDVPNLLNFNRGRRKLRWFLIICYVFGVWLFSKSLYALTYSQLFYSNPGQMILYGQWLKSMA